LKKQCLFVAVATLSAVPVLAQGGAIAAPSSQPAAGVIGSSSPAPSRGRSSRPSPPTMRPPFGGLFPIREATPRARHGVRPLWAFHSVHHTQTQLTFLSANRIHFFEQLYVGVLMIVPAFLLGIPQPRWLPILFVQIFSETVQHARLNWTFGRLHRLVVSPAAHAVHHSIDAGEHHSNFGRVFLLWDVLFGTFVPAEERVRRFGVDGMEVPERLTAQLVHPFRVLLGRA